MLTNHLRMSYENRPRSARARSLRLSLAVLCLALGGCDPFPEGGYAKVANRERDPHTAAAAPPPPAYVAGAGAGAGPVPTLAQGSAPAGVTQEMVEQGAQQFSTVCAACHAAGGAGGPAGPPLNDAQWLNISGSYEEIVTIINTGVPQPKEFPAAMPPRGGGAFDEVQVRALAAYVFALSHSQGS